VLSDPVSLPTVRAAPVDELPKNKREVYDQFGEDGLKGGGGPPGGGGFAGGFPGAGGGGGFSFSATDPNDIFK